MTSKMRLYDSAKTKTHFPFPITPRVARVRMNIVLFSIIVEKFCLAIGYVGPPISVDLAIIKADHLVFPSFFSGALDPVVESVAFGT